MRSKSKNRKNIKDYSITIPVITLILGTFIGSGGVWQWMQLKLNQANLKLNQANQELEKVPKIVELRNNIEQEILKFVGLLKKHNDLIYEMSQQIDGMKKENIGREIDRIWRYEYPVIENNIVTLESRLSQLENREPKKFGLGAPPKAPIDLKISLE